MATFLEMQDDVIGMVSRPNIRDLVKRKLNERAKSLALPFRFKELEATSIVTTVAAQEGYSITDINIAVIDFARDLTNDVKLEIRDIEWLENQSSSSEGAPEAIVHYGGGVIVYPTPDDVLDIRLRGRRFPVTMVADTDVCELPEDWHPIVVKLAASEMFFYYGHAERGMEMKNEALGEISSRQEVEVMERRRKPGQMGVTRTKGGRGQD